MRPRPDLFKALLLAGLLGMIFIPTGLGWGVRQPALLSVSAKTTTPAPARPVTEGSSLQTQESLTTAPESPGRLLCPPPSRAQSLMKFLAGGYLGTFLWHHLFCYPLPGYKGSDYWPPGLLDLVALFSLAYLGYRLLKPSPPKTRAPAPPGFMPALLQDVVELTVSNEALPGLAQISASDPAFNLSAFAQYARQIITELYTAWNQEDLGSLQAVVTEEIFNFFDMGSKILQMRGEISRLEDITLKRLVVSAAGQLEDRDFILIWVQGRLVDYVLDRKTFKVLAGSLTYPKEWEEYWRFERPRGQRAWKVSDIREY